MSPLSLLAHVTKRFHPLRQALLDLVFPPRCAACHRSGAWLCADCQAAIPPMPTPVCARCGRPIRRPGLCSLCHREPPPLSAIRAAAVFGGPLRPAIHCLKYKGQRDLAQPLGALMARAWPGDLMPGDCLIPVPLHPGRERERGYNQARLLAEALGQEVRLPVIPHALHRTRATQPQVHLDAQTRRVNVAAAFSAGEANLRGRRPVLVDDDCTTSATLAACAQALWQAGVTDVWAYTLARAAWDPTQTAPLPDHA